jgi:taurine dioxygenase
MAVTATERNAIAAVRPLSPAVGAEIVGLDLSRPFDDATFGAVKDAWLRHSVLLFRDQKLTEADQSGFAARFGELGRLVTKHEQKFSPGVMLVSNIRENGKPIGVLPDGEMFFHSDQCYAECPTMATLLYSIELPSRGGNTIFASMYAAYEELPDATKQLLAGVTALNVYDYGTNATVRSAGLGDIAARSDVPSYAHPVVRTHPETGRKALYVNRLMTDSIAGLPREESDRLLEELFAHQEQRRFQYEHAWRPGDLIMWDNRCTLHARTDFPATERRLLRRVVVQGDRPA